MRFRRSRSASGPESERRTLAQATSSTAISVLSLRIRRLRYSGESRCESEKGFSSGLELIVDSWRRARYAGSTTKPISGSAAGPGRRNGAAARPCEPGKKFRPRAHAASDAARATSAARKTKQGGARPPWHGPPPLLPVRSGSERRHHQDHLEGLELVDVRPRPADEQLAALLVLQRGTHARAHTLAALGTHGDVLREQVADHRIGRAADEVAELEHGVLDRAVELGHRALGPHVLVRQHHQVGAQGDRIREWNQDAALADVVAYLEPELERDVDDPLTLGAAPQALDL